MPFYAASHLDHEYDSSERYSGAIGNKGKGKCNTRTSDEGDAGFSPHHTSGFYRETSVNSCCSLQGSGGRAWRAPLRLTHLPLDTLILVLSYLTPHEILSLRKASKRLHAVSYERIVWLDALRQLCRARSIFGGTFPLNSMTQRQLEHAATTPARFSSMVSCDREERARMRVSAERDLQSASSAPGGPPPGGGMHDASGDGGQDSERAEWEQEEEEAAAAARAPIRPIATRVLLPRTPRGKIQNALMMAATADFSSNHHPTSISANNAPANNAASAPPAAHPHPQSTHPTPTASAAPVSYGVFETSYLVPGGRFLLTRTYGNLLQVWDLGWSADMMVQPESVAAVHLGSGELQFDPDAQMTPDGEGLLIFVASENVFRIFEVQPLAEAPTFRKIASIDVVLGGRCVYVFTSEVIVYCMGRRVTVWNYRDDTIATWGVRLGRVWDIAFTDKHVVLLDQTGFSVFRVPPMRPRTTEAALLSAFAAPAMALAVANVAPGQQNMPQVCPLRGFRKQGCVNCSHKDHSYANRCNASSLPVRDCPQGRRQLVVVHSRHQREADAL
ncbi:hypothetical protein HGRIS_011472 [Hohenbuehelia grisea]|uniref:F-box domain-containing protein n=1 Tax=Hohenbuehelia grisea TaxID=104357 RepID=A0ABR3JW05_9AGAR